IVQGDTTTAFASTLAAFYERVPVAHVEAGLRTGDLFAPWREELNRRLISPIAKFHFAPTEQARLNLLREGVDDTSVWVTGNTVIDALLETKAKLETTATAKGELDGRFSFLSTERKLILVTGHRRENFGNGFENICHALSTLSQRPDVEIVYPVHLNPNVREPVGRILRS